MTFSVPLESFGSRRQIRPRSGCSASARVLIFPHTCRTISSTGAMPASTPLTIRVHVLTSRWYVAIHAVASPHCVHAFADALGRPCIVAVSLVCHRRQHKRWPQLLVRRQPHADHESYQQHANDVHCAGFERPTGLSRSQMVPVTLLALSVLPIRACTARRKTTPSTWRIHSSTFSASRARARRRPSCTCSLGVATGLGCARVPGRCASGPKGPRSGCRLRG